jgi:proline iminopeptidase
VTHGHRLHVRQLGHPQGKPVLVLHGGPGSGCSPLLWRFLNPERFRIIAPDQRGSGLSEPSGCCDDNDLDALLSDLPTLHQALGLTEPWLVVGGSWGATLALAHAADQPDLIAGLLLRATFLGRDTDVDDFFTWRAGDPPAIHHAMAAFQTPVDARLIDGLHAALHGDDGPRAEAAALAWWRWEQVASQPGWVDGDGVRRRTAPDLWPDPPPMTRLLSRLRIQSHYLRSGCGLRARPLLDRLNQLPHVPVQLLHGRADRICAVEGAIALAQALQERQADCALTVLDGVGHDPSHPLLVDAMVRALDHWAESATFPQPGDPT